MPQFSIYSIQVSKYQSVVESDYEIIVQSFSSRVQKPNTFVMYTNPETNKISADETPIDDMDDLIQTTGANGQPIFAVNRPNIMYNYKKYNADSLLLKDMLNAFGARGGFHKAL